MLHDVGKVGIDDAILKAPGKLTPEQRKIMEQHTRIGAARGAHCDGPGDP
jgi:putative two-component system response regulator